MSPVICGQRHPITRGRCVLPPDHAAASGVGESLQPPALAASPVGASWHQTQHGETWSTRPEDDPVVNFDGAGEPIRRSQLPRSLRRQR